MTITAILIGSGGELDRVTFKTKDDNVDLGDLLAAVEKENGSPWILGDGDTIRIVED